MVFGGGAGDGIEIGTGNSVVFGDSGYVEIDGTLPTLAYSIDTAKGGIDTITTGNGDQIVAGGAFGDTITTGNGNSVVFGDSAHAEFDGTLPTLAYSLDTGIGGADTITTGNGDQIVAGGAFGDKITTGNGSDIIFGDNARFEFAIFGAGQARRAELQQGFTINPMDGGNDVIKSNGANDIVIGGTGADEIHGGEGNDRLFGDHALFDVTLPRNQRIISIYTTGQDGAGNDTIHGDGGHDIIVGQQGNDYLHGEVGDDDITGGHNMIGGADGNDYIEGGAGEDVLIGDNGVIARNIIGGTSWKNTQWQLNPVVPGKAASLLRDVILFDHVDFVGGADNIHGGDSDDRIFGQRGNDSLFGDNGIDEIVGGLGSDVIEGGAGADIALGDEGQITQGLQCQRQRPPEQRWYMASRRHPGRSRHHRRHRVDKLEQIGRAQRPGLEAPRSRHAASCGRHQCQRRQGHAGRRHMGYAGDRHRS